MYIPDSATMSLRSRPTFWNLETSVATSEFGAGMLLLAAAWLAVKLSFLPICTSHPGPPDWRILIQSYQVNVSLKMI